MKNLSYIFVVVLAVISVFSVIFCLFRIRGKSHKKLICFTSLFGAVMTVCFGGEAVLAHFGMGWRCTPFNIMLFLCVILFIITLGHCIHEFSCLEDAAHPSIVVCGFVSLILTVVVTLMLATLYFQILSWHDSLSAYNGQTIVCANDMHGGSCSWRYYTHINGLVHGIEITQNGWWGYPPF